MQDIVSRLARRARGRAPSPIRELVPLMRIPGMISFGGGYPNPETFAFDRVEVAFKSGARVVLEGRELVEASQYGASEGHPTLVQELIAWHEHKDGVRLGADQLVVLNGSQEGLFAAGFLLLDEGDSVVVSEPDYPGALSAFRCFSEETLAVPLDAEGLDTAALEAGLAERVSRGEPMPKLVYCVPSGHNPGGVALSLPRRHELVRLARRYDLLILEDDPYQLVRLDDSALPPTLQSLAPERVLRLDSFSKIFAPGLRLGYATGPGELVRQIVLFKQAANLHTSAFAQAILQRFIAEVGFDGFRAEIRKSCSLYRANRDVMAQTARELLPPEVRFNLPGEGMFLWLELPPGCDTGRMIAADTREELVILVPGTAFSTRGGLANCMRASFSMVSPQQIKEGVARLARMLDRELARAGLPVSARSAACAADRRG